jgi:hypothetical protein
MKNGLDYFSLDVDIFEDEKVQFTSALYGPESELMIIKLLCRIYRQGYYYDWTNDQMLLFAKNVNIFHENVDKIVKELIKREFFDSNLYTKYSILTSRGIQKRYFEAVKRRRDLQVVREFLLVNVDILPENVTFSEEMSQKFSVLKEVKEVKEVKVYSIPYQKIIDLYHEILPELPQVSKLTEKRKVQIKARWMESEKTQSLEWWKEFFETVKDRPFLLGKNDRGWTADIDFLTTQSKFIKIIEGKYK